MEMSASWPPADALCFLPQTLSTTLVPGRVYRYCIWARIASDSVPSAAANINMLLAPLGVSTPSTTTVAVTNSTPMQRICLGGITVAASTSVYFTVDLGTALVTWLLDDAALESVAAGAAPLLAPTPTPSPTPTPASRSGGDVSGGLETQVC